MSDNKQYTCFENKAGDNQDNDYVLKKELENAGIPTWENRFFRNEGDVKSSVIGVLNNCTFKRAWVYWIVDIKGGLPLDVAIKLHEQYGTTLRVGGFAGGIDPREMFGGFGVPTYHIDTPQALKALADAIKEVVAKNNEICETLKLKPWKLFKE